MKGMARQAWRDAERRVGMQAQFAKKGVPVTNLDTGELTSQDILCDVIAVSRRLTNEEIAAVSTTVPQKLKGWSIRADLLHVQEVLIDASPQDIVTCQGARYEVLMAAKDGMGIRWRLTTREMHG